MKKKKKKKIKDGVFYPSEKDEFKINLKPNEKIGIINNGFKFEKIVLQKK
jgi:hypothetical protein